ncbi:MAG: DNA ligase [Pseudomonadota bacterium]|nr:DNA ligase [Pseudomonadota bacterium]
MNLRVFWLFALLCVAPALPAQQAARADPEMPGLMHAISYVPGLDVSEYWISEKLDGVRGHWDGRRLRTRSGSDIAVPAWFTAGWPAVPMDGELWIGRGRFEQVSAMVRASPASDPAWHEVRFMVFDLPAHQGRFQGRVGSMRAMLSAAGIAWLRPVPQFRIADATLLDARLAAVVAAGGEGLMLHHRDARYRAGRSEGLLKYKMHDDAEAVVIGHTAGKGKYAGMLGALIVQRADGLQFRLGSGLSDAQRADPPPVGTQVTYRYNGLTVHGVPRFARLMRVRH